MSIIDDPTRARTGRRRVDLIHSLVMTALLLAGDQTAGAQPAPSALEVIMPVETVKGRRQRILPRDWEHLAGRTDEADRKALESALGRKEVLAPLLASVACPAGTPPKACTPVRILRDINIESALAASTAPGVLLVWPRVGYVPEKRVYFARFHVDYHLPGGREPAKSFRVQYVEWNCGSDCVEAAFAASQTELAAMVRYMIDIEFSSNSRQAPPSWKGKPQLKKVAQWANQCVSRAERVENYRVVREHGERFWIGAPNRNVLASVPWRGCSTFDAGAPPASP